MNLAPIALFVYKRPEHTRQAVEALLANPLASQSELHVFSDAPRTPQDADQVAEVRSFLRTIRGFRALHFTEQTVNQGLAQSIITGVTKLCATHGSVIVMEDDLIVAPTFLYYMNDALERYREHDRVMQISGYMFPVSLDVSEDAVFLPFTTSWGWATWQRAWKSFDPQANGYERLCRDRKLRKRFDLDDTYGYFRMLQAQLRGEIDSWAIRWYLTVFMAEGLTLYPAVSLVRNIGFDGSGTHCGARGYDDVVQSTLTFDRWPTSVEVITLVQQRVYGFLRMQNPGIFRKIMRKFFGWHH